MKRAGILFILMIFAAGNFNAVANNELIFKNDLNIAVNVYKMHFKLQYSDHDPVKSQVTDTQGEVLPTPVEEPEARMICVYPNPCVYSMKVTGIQPEDELVVYNSVGQVVLTKIAENSEETIDVSNMAPGIYHLAIVNSKIIDKIDFIK